MTSGLGGVFRPAIPVARVTEVQRDDRAAARAGARRSRWPHVDTDREVMLV